MDFLLIVIGVALLYGGGEALVDGASKLALRWGVRPIVIGLTVVALGTSMPEMAASLIATLGGSPGVAFGNVVGSNIANLGLVLGVGAMVCTLHVQAQFLQREVPFMVGSSVLMMFFAWDGALDRLEGMVLLLLLAVFLTVQFRKQSESREVRDEFREGLGGPGTRTTAWLLALIVVGMVALTLGAKALVTGAVGIARDLGVAERVIGLTVVAFGTSLPEMAGTLVAARRREGDIVLGNLIGSNVFNILFILAVVVLVRPMRVDALNAEIDLAVMLGFSLLVWPLMRSGRRLAFWEGALLTTLYVAYVVWLFVAA